MKQILTIILFFLSLTVAAQMETVVLGKIPENQRNEVHKKGISEITISYGDIFADEEKTFRSKLSDSLTFCVKVPLIFDKQIVNINFSEQINFNIFVSVGDTTSLEIDMKNVPEWRPFVFRAYYEYVKFSGRNADVNAALASEIFRDCLSLIEVWKQERTHKIKNYPETIDFFNQRKRELVAAFDSVFQQIDLTSYSAETKSFIKAELNGYASNYFMRKIRNIRKVYCYGLTYKKLKKDNYRLDMDSATLSFIDSFDFNDDNIKSTSQFYETAILLQDAFAAPFPGEKRVRPEVIFTNNDIVLQYVTNQDIMLQKSQNAPANCFTVKSTSQKDIWFEIFDSRRGHVVIVDFWYPNCSGCLFAQREISKIQPELLSQGVEFVYISTEKNAELCDYYKVSANLKGDSYLLTAQQFDELSKKYKINVWPRYLIIGKDGEIAYSSAGYRGNDFFRSKIEAELKK